jgi:hypothetical protein
MRSVVEKARNLRMSNWPCLESAKAHRELLGLRTTRRNPPSARGTKQQSSLIDVRKAFDTEWMLTGFAKKTWWIDSEPKAWFQTLRAGSAIFTKSIFVV